MVSESPVATLSNQARVAAEYNATLIGRVEVTPGLVILRVAPDKLPFDFEPGQYALLGLKAAERTIEEADGDGAGVAAGGASAATPHSRSSVEAQAAVPAAGNPDRMIRRAFCIASENRAGEFLEFYVTVILSGQLTPRLFNLKVGDRLWVGPKAEGYFTLDKLSTKHVLMIATGTGLAPYMAMIRSELGLRVGGHIGLRAVWQCNGQRQFVIAHGARYSWDLGYRAELMGLARHCTNLHYIPVITRPDEDATWRGLSGHLQDVIASDAIEEQTGLDITPDNFEVFLAGNPGMIDTVIDWAEARGFSRGQGGSAATLHVEKFW